MVQGFQEGWLGWARGAGLFGSDGRLSRCCHRLAMCSAAVPPAVHSSSMQYTVCSPPAAPGTLAIAGNQLRTCYTQVGTSPNETVDYGSTDVCVVVPLASVVGILDVCLVACTYYPQYVRPRSSHWTDWKLPGLSGNRTGRVGSLSEQFQKRVIIIRAHVMIHTNPTPLSVGLADLFRSRINERS